MNTFLRRTAFFPNKEIFAISPNKLTRCIFRAIILNKCRIDNNANIYKRIHEIRENNFKATKQNALKKTAIRMRIHPADTPPKSGEICLTVLLETENVRMSLNIQITIPVYNKTDVPGLQNFLRDKFVGWAGNGSSVQEIWINFKNRVYESIARFVPHKILRKNSDFEYYSKEIRRLKIKVRKAYNRRNLGVQYTEGLKHLSKQLLAAKKSAQEAFLKSILSNEGKCWNEFYKYVKRRRGIRENIPAINDCNGPIVTDAIDKANTFNSYYSTVFSSEDNIPNIQSENIGNPFTTDIKKLGKN